MPTWWDTAKPFVEALAAAVAFPLSAASIVWLALQARRARETDRIAREAHQWARERRDAEQERAREEEAKRRWWKESRDAIDASGGSVPLPQGIDPAWIVEGERTGHFRRSTGKQGEARLATPDPHAQARDLKRAERRGELAEQSLLAIQGVCSHLHLWSAILHMETTQDRGGDDARLEGIKSAVAFGDELVGPLRSQLNRILFRASVHLDPEERRLICDAEGLLVQVQLDAGHWLKNAGSVELERVRDVFLGLHRAADDLRARADRTLGPIARFDTGGKP